MGEQELNDELNNSDDDIKKRLAETRDFFKNLGSYIINSMVGYLSLTTIIDRIIGDPLYGASKFGDIKELMIKMLEMCSYEQILLTKTSSLVSRDVYANMLVYKRISCKSYSLFSVFCQYCSRPLDLSTKAAADSLSTNSAYSNTSNMSQPHFKGNNNTVNAISPSPNSSNLEALDSKMSITMYQCGHSFHLSCLEIMQTVPTAPCPTCIPISTLQMSAPEKTAKLKQKIKKNNQNNRMSNGGGNKIIEFDDEMSGFGGGGSEASTSKMRPNASSSSLATDNKLSSGKDSLNEDEFSPSKNPNKSTLTNQQISALKSIRNRNMSLFRVNSNNMQQTASDSLKSSGFNTNLERQGKLSLAPANLVKFI